MDRGEPLERDGQSWPSDRVTCAEWVVGGGRRPATPPSTEVPRTRWLPFAGTQECCMRKGVQAGKAGLPEALSVSWFLPHCPFWSRSRRVQPWLQCLRRAAHFGSSQLGTQARGHLSPSAAPATSGACLGFGGSHSMEKTVTEPPPPCCSGLSLPYGSFPSSRAV